VAGSARGGSDWPDEEKKLHADWWVARIARQKKIEASIAAKADEEAWASLNSDTSRPFRKPKSGRIAVKVINHLGDEVMKVLSVL
jgi:adenine-specific DNA-methyltransferase